MLGIICSLHPTVTSQKHQHFHCVIGHASPMWPH